MIWLVAAWAGCNTAPEPLAEDAEPLGYAIGYRVGQDFAQMDQPIDADSVVAGVRDALSGHEPALSAEQQQALLEALAQPAR